MRVSTVYVVTSIQDPWWRWPVLETADEAMRAAVASVERESAFLSKAGGVPVTSGIDPRTLIIEARAHPDAILACLTIRRKVAAAREVTDRFGVTYLGRTVAEYARMATKEPEPEHRESFYEGIRDALDRVRARLTGRAH